MSPVEENFVMLARLIGADEHWEELDMLRKGWPKRKMNAAMKRYFARIEARSIEAWADVVAGIVSAHPERFGVIARAFANVAAEHPENNHIRLLYGYTQRKAA